MFSPASKQTSQPKQRHGKPTPLAKSARTKCRHNIAKVFAVLLSLTLFTSVLLPAQAQAQTTPTFVFTGAGWGHGVGMSQNGARNMADRGLDHVSILAYYYPNSFISKNTERLGDIRVHIGDATDVELVSAGVVTYEHGGQTVHSRPGGTDIKAVPGGLQVGATFVAATKETPVIVSFNQALKVTNNGHTYVWGKFQLTNHEGKVRVVEKLPFEKYIAGISEMPASWHIEALMSQAIAARSYAHQVTLTRRNSPTWNRGYDISATTVDQNYVGWDAQDSTLDLRWTTAVAATAGVEIYAGGGPIRAYYSASNGGYTETSNYVFGYDTNYTVAKPDPYDTGRHQWSSWTRSYSQAQMSRWLNGHPDTSVGTLTRINVLGGQGSSARLDKSAVELVGTNGTKRVSGNRLMRVINAGVFGEGGGLSTHLPSTFTTIGNGASAGMPVPSGRIGDGPTITNRSQETAASLNSGTSVTQNVQTHTGQTNTGQTNTATTNGSVRVPTSEITAPEGWKPPAGAVGIAPANANQTTATQSGQNTSAGSAGTAGSVRVPSSEITAPEGWKPPAGAVGIAPTNAQGTSSANPSSDAGNRIPSSAITAPPGWKPQPGAVGIKPSSNYVGGTGGAASFDLNQQDLLFDNAVLLVTRQKHAEGKSDVKYTLLEPGEAVADARSRQLLETQRDVAIGLFAGLDIDGYLETVHDRPVHALCISQSDGIVCVPMSALEAIRNIKPSK